MVTKETVLSKLKLVFDPELSVNIVELGLIYGIKIIGSTVRVKLTLTTPGCPMSSYFEKSVEDAILKIKGIKKVQIDLTFNPPWSPEKMTEEARVQLGL